MIDINLKDLKKISHNQTTSERLTGFFMIAICILTFTSAIIFNNLQPMHFVMLFFNVLLLFIGFYLLYTTADAYFAEDFIVVKTVFFKKKVYFENIVSIRESRRRHRVYINLKFRQNNNTFSANFFQAAQYNALEMIKEKLISKGKSDCIF